MAQTALSQATTIANAHEIMGRNFFGVNEAIKELGIDPRTAQLILLANTPFSESVLEACKDTHILAAVFPLSLLDIREACKGQGLFYNQEWYNKQAFAKEKGEVGWQLIRKTPVSDSTSKTWAEQNKLLGKDDEVPSARALIYTMIGHFKATGERLFEKIWVRCSDLDSGGTRVVVGDFDARGLYVDSDWDDYRDDDLGLASARKF
jgi:hypothetical protein